MRRARMGPLAARGPIRALGRRHELRNEGVKSFGLREEASSSTFFPSIHMSGSMRYGRQIARAHLPEYLRC